MHVAAGVVTFAIGAFLVVVVFDSALRTFVLPRAAAVPFTRIIFATVRSLFTLRTRWARSYEARDRAMALYAPVTLMVLPAVWLVTVLAGYTLMFHALGVTGWRKAFTTSGSSLLTLGFEHPPDLPTTSLAFSQAAIGLAVLALLIAYLPTIYGAFSKREVMVAQVSVYAGAPPSAVELLRRAAAILRLDDLDDLWRAYQLWFAELEETHTSLAVLNFFRSPAPDRSWVTAAGAVLDAASLVNSTVDVPWAPQAGMCVRAGFTALRAIADLFGIPHDKDPSPDDPISIAREEYDDTCRQLADAGVRLKPDREQAWRDFKGWRVNYDQVLIAIAGLVMAPYAVWSSDRSLRYRRPPLRGRRR